MNREPGKKESPTDTYQQLLRGNKDFVEENLKNDPGFFDKLAAGQHLGISEG